MAAEQRNMATEDGERGGLRRKPTGPPRLLLGRTRTRSTGEETKPEPAGNGEETSAVSDDQTACRGRQSAAGKRRRRWWSGMSSAVGCIRRQEDGEASPPEGALQRQEDHEAGPPEGALQRHEKTRKMRNVLRRFVPLRKKSSPWFRTKLQKFFIRTGRRRSVPPGHEEDAVLGTDLCASGLAGILEGPPQVQMFCYQAKCLPEDPEPTAEMTDPEDGPVPVQTAHINQVLVRDVSSEEDEVLFDSELVVDLHDQPAFKFPTEDKTVQMSVPPQPSINGPSIRIQLCPPDDSAQEEEEEEGWVGVASAESHLLHLICSDPSERQLLQAAQSLVRTAMTAAVDQLTREQRGGGGSAHLEPPGAR
ncbi:PREDICTED: uncharacterized protein LOC106911297 [Poecilia mexicana]|uniref:uncharacterized protein LOC106911297 n=1 Tax=Poecilia mexicana TaxID=48701 RepID=UPI00072EB963|nr:PREDICTED: uncharacterized protein LOC106911297 [Poecilia mexicana]XP_014833566.1 PREDICTED: uncharacterized protein LOC106911297 [Poecilia mexicana]XP_014833567.1 PREDICTED: uncharacterized protein LOC106911297 [Poecilia mexicana]